MQVTAAVEMVEAVMATKLGTAACMIEAAERLQEADCETLWAMVKETAERSENPLPKTILEQAEREHWTVQHTALAIAYVLMMQGK
jgi:hypothetical protein